MTSNSWLSIVISFHRKSSMLDMVAGSNIIIRYGSRHLYRLYWLVLTYIEVMDTNNNTYTTYIFYNGTTTTVDNIAWQNIWHKSGKKTIKSVSIFFLHIIIIWLAIIFISARLRKKPYYILLLLYLYNYMGSFRHLLFNNRFISFCHIVRVYVDGYIFYIVNAYLLIHIVFVYIYIYVCVCVFIIIIHSIRRKRLVHWTWRGFGPEWKYCDEAMRVSDMFLFLYSCVIW